MVGLGAETLGQVRGGEDGLLTPGRRGGQEAPHNFVRREGWVLEGRPNDIVVGDVSGLVVQVDGEGDGRGRGSGDEGGAAVEGRVGA